MTRSLPALALALAALAFFPLDSALAKPMGGLKPGDSFQLKVRRVISTKQVGAGGTRTRSSVPRGVPRFRPNQKIRFTIRAGGKLSAPQGINLPFAHFKGGVAEFDRYRPGSVAMGSNAEITVRNRTGVGGNLSFFVSDSSGVETIYRTVIYKLVRG